MIPVCTKQTVNIEEDGINWVFMPKTGALECDLLQMSTAMAGKSVAEQVAAGGEFLNKILCGWSGGNMPAFPTDGNPAALFNSDERLELLNLWARANDLTAQEKKVS